MFRCIKFFAVAALVCAAGIGLRSPAGAVAAQPDPVADCSAHLRLTREYTPQQLQHALDTMSAETREYTDCYTVIQNQLLTQLGEHHGGHASGAGSGGSFLPTPLLVVLGVLVLASAGLGVVALRRRLLGRQPR